MTTLNDKRVLITAGSGGIGRAIAEAFAASGAKVHACDIDEAALSALRAQAPRITTSICDIADRSAVQRMVKEAADSLGGLPPSR